MSIHSRIQAGRKRLGMSPQQFADAVGVTRGAVQQWEKEGGTAPTRAHQKKVANLIGLSVAQLMSQDQDEALQTPGIQENTPTAVVAMSISSVIFQLASHLSRMDADTQQLASGLLRDLALRPSLHSTISAALQAMADQPKRQSA